MPETDLKYCPRFNAIAYADDTDRRLVTRLRCGQWSCPFCAVKERDIWRAAIINAVNVIGGKWSFWTLTLPAYVRNRSNEYDRLEQSIKLIRAGWDKLMKRAKREYGKFEYVRVLESHKDGTLHIHILASFHVPELKHVKRADDSEYHYSDWHKKHVPECGLGYQLDIKNLGETVGEGLWHAGQVAGYVTKYMTKDMQIVQDVRSKVRFRKIQTSRGIKKISTDSGLTWHRAYHLHVSDLLRGKRDWFDLNLDKTLELVDFDASGHYPASDTSEFYDLERFGMTRDEKTGHVRVLTDSH